MKLSKRVGFLGLCLALGGLVACGDDGDPGAVEDGGVERDGGDGDGDGDDDGGNGDGDGDGDTDASVGGAAISGVLRGPVGAQVTLRHADEELVVTVARAAGNTDLYDATPFAFDESRPDGTEYEVTILEQPDDMVCAIYRGASGVLPIATGALLVGCERLFDHVSRSSDTGADTSEALGTFFDSTEPVVGGADQAIGSTAEGYGEGRFVAFVSSADGLPGSNGDRQIYWRDVLSGQTMLVSANAAGDAGDGNSFAPAISADGLIVVFESSAENLVADDANGVRDIFIWSATEPDGVERASVGPDDVEADGESFGPTVSGDGRIIAFSTGASNLTAGVSGNSTINVVRRDVVTRENVLITANELGEGVGGDRPMLSEDGNRLAYWSFAADLTAGDSNGLWDIFVYQHDDGSQRRVSLTASGAERDQGDESSSRVVSPTISGDGRYVAYSTTATNVVDGDDNGAQDIFVVDLDTDDVVRASLGEDDVEGDGDSPVGQGERVALSYDGRWLGFRSQSTTFGAGAGNMFLRNLDDGELIVVTDFTFGTGTPSLSREAGYLTFGGASELDARFDSTGIFSYFTGITPSWWWVE